MIPARRYTPEPLLRSPGRAIRAMWADLGAAGHLAWRLAARDISAQYRQAALGLLWAFILPLANTAIWLFLNRSGVIRMDDTALPYSIYVFVGTMLWAIFMDAANAPLKHVEASRQMLTKINFPREALILEGIYVTVFNAGIRLLVMLPAVVALGVWPDAGLAFFPLLLILLILAGTVLGVALTPVGLLYTDVGKSLPVLLQFLMFLSPVVFTIPSGGWARVVFEFNPLTPLLVNARHLVTGQPVEMLTHTMLVGASLVVLIFVMWLVFRAALSILIERLGA